MFYTGAGSAEGGLKQRVGLATSSDLYQWRKHPASPVLASDDRWYEQLPNTRWPDETWRDPWIVPDPHSGGWHMLITARSCDGPADQRGAIGHAWSRDLLSWQVQEPLSKPGGFGQTEVPQVETVDGRPVLIFSCLTEDLSSAWQRAGKRGGIWSVPGDSELGPFDLSRAALVVDQSLYSGRIIRDRDGNWVMVAFRNQDSRGRFAGEITDPLPIGWTADYGGLALLE
jgi:beta-fructofuranosidase